MTDLFQWSIDLGRWAGSRVRVHISLLILVAFALIGGATSDPPRLLPTLAWLGVLIVVLAMHEWGHILAAAWRQAEAEDVLLWPLGNFVGPSKARSHEDPWAAAGGLLVSGGLAVATFVGLRIAGAAMILNPFGGPVDSGAPLVPGEKGLEAVRALTPLWYAGWFGWLNWVVFLANLLPALPFDGGRIVRATIGRSTIGESRDAMISPWLGHSVAAVLGLAGLLRLFTSRNLGDFLTLACLALLIEMIVRVESRLMEEGSFFDDGVFGYDFSEGYTSLEASTAKVRPYRESAIKRWRRRRSALRKQRRQAQLAAEDRRLDEVLDKLHREGKAALTDEENRFLIRVSSRIKKRPKDRD